ncbi:MAG: exodeoxyribonuclease VII large subunit [Candidatus Aldehydirespiratoraceae bacterium]
MNDQTLTVSELGTIVRAALEAAMPYGVWVEGEISGISRSRNGHVYFDLIEPADVAGAAPVATVPVVLFRDNRDRVNRLLKRHGDPIRMSDGVRIRIQGTVDYYPPQGRIQLRMSAIDPTYTLGQLAAERDALMTALSADGLLRANARPRIPDVPMRVGIVTSIGSAAHADITTVFERSELSFTLVEVDTPVQGQGAEASVAAAIRAADAADVDVILVARGGGSKTDLATFDHELVARAIAAATVPVITGVGHDIDRSVADEVAHTATTTPTAAAQLVVARANEWLGRLAERERAVVSGGRRAVERAEHRVAMTRSGISTASMVALDHAEERLGHDSERLTRSARRADTRARAQLDLAVARIDVARRHALRRAEDRVELVEARVRAIDPAIALARGWSITRTRDGRVVKSIDNLAPGTEITTRVADGTATSTITELTKKANT